MLAVIVGAVRPSKKALGAQPGTPDVEVVQVAKENVRCMRNCFMDEGNASESQSTAKRKSGVRGAIRKLGMKSATTFYKMKRLSITPALSHSQDLGAYG